ncbi:hypothetical protein KEM48_012903 [Puccinia striiformis f. sp. tritici PST-130]|nr:hypothetical protein KEM48_012903 [Puccinia striiformis f. sp. tritici PST-130]
MEYSFNPSASSSTKQPSTKKIQQRPKPSKNFGIGLSKGSIARDQEENFIQSLNQDNLSGRTQKIKIKRSASTTKIRSVLAIENKIHLSVNGRSVQAINECTALLVAILATDKLKIS